jgi:hypothetical protein
MSVLDIVKTIQQSVPIPEWKVKSGNIGTGVFVSSTVCNEWTVEEFEATQTWCVFGTGEGYVYFELAKRLVDAGHSLETVFTSGMLIGYDIDVSSVNIIKQKVANLFNIDKNSVTVYEQNYFELEETVKFDNFIINSPYLDGSKGNSFVSHKHTQVALDHWNRKGKAVSITKSSPFLSNERGAKTIREQIFDPKNNTIKVRNLPDDAFTNAIVRTMYWLMDPNSEKSELDFIDKTGNCIYSIPNNKLDYIFPTLMIKSIVELIGTNFNVESHYITSRTSNNVESSQELDTIVLLNSGKPTIEKTKSKYFNYGNYSVVLTFQVNGDVKDAYRSHTHNSCIVNPNQSVRKDYTVIDCGDSEKEAKSVLYQIKHPLNAWIHAHTRTSDQSSRSPQFKFCCRIPTDEFYNLWLDGNPSVSEYFEYWKIPINYQIEILDWYSKYV